jgi:CRP-like cAMP-binding protein
MSAISIPSTPNMLLASLSLADSDRLQPHLRQETLALRHVLEQPNKRISNVYFIEAGIASVVAVQADDNVEVGLIGCEGMSGLAIVLGNHRSPLSTYMQVAGSAQRICAVELRKALDERASLHMSLLKYAQAFLAQTSHTATSNARAKLHRRLARWILMVHDRIGHEALPVTHELVSVVLGVRRAGITEAHHALESMRLIATARRQIIVRDRKGIEQLAGSSYGVPEAEYRRLMRAG